MEVKNENILMANDKKQFKRREIFLVTGFNN